MRARGILSAVVLIAMASTILAQQKSIDLSFPILEEVPPNTHIGNVARESGLLAKYGQPVASKLIYRIMISSGAMRQYFKITSKGILVNSKVLDREEICPSEDDCIIELNIVAMANQIFERLTVKVEIQDLNDHDPTFTGTEQVIEVSENARFNSSFPISPAQDKDSRPNGVTTYRLKSPSDAFDLRVTRSGVTGELEPALVLITTLDHEVQNEYNLELEAVDGGNPPKVGSVAIKVKVQDENDNCPSFEKSSYSESILENVEQGYTVLTVKASDADSGDNGRITYSFNRKTSDLARRHFRLEGSTGKLTVRRLLDYDKADTYVMIVQASDGGSKPCVATATVTVRLEDVNDQEPAIAIDPLSESPFVQVYENEPAGTFINGHITVFDGDSGDAGKVDCKLLNTPDFTLVGIGEGEYRVKTNRVFNREITAVFRATIQCRDQGAPPLVTTETFQIKIADRNDRNPQFVQKSYSAKVKENRDSPEYVTTILAVDDDLGANGQVKYSIIGDFANRHFRISNETGIITIKRPLDREANDSVVFEVIAMDQGKPSRIASVMVNVEISDENDNPPEFVGLPYEFSVVEEQDPPITVGVIKAVDLDATATEPVNLHLDENAPDADKFMLTSDGRILTKERLDREKKKFYNLRVIATDGIRPAPPKSTTADIIIHVKDVNDNPPVIHYPGTFNNSIYISYLQPKGAEVAKVRASDRDSGKNGELEYKYWEPSTDASDLFLLNKDSGAVSLARKLDSKDIGKYRLAIFVKDLGIRSYTKLVDMNIHITEPINIPGYPRAGEHNLIIVIILACVSAAVTVVIIMLIIFIRSKDRQTHRYNARREEEKKDTMMRNVEVVLDCDTYKQIRTNDGRPSVGKKMDNGGYSLSPQSKETDMDSTGSHSATSTLLAPAGTDGTYQLPRRALYNDPRYVPVQELQGYQQQPPQYPTDYRVSSTMPREAPRSEYSSNATKSSTDVVQPNYPTMLREVDVDKVSACDSGKGASDEDLRTLRERDQRPRSGYHGNYAMQTFSPRVGSRLLAAVQPRQASPASSLPSSSNETVIHVDKASDSNLSSKLSDPKLNDTKLNNISPKESFEDGSIV